MHDVDLELEVFNSGFEDGDEYEDYMTRSADGPRRNWEGFH